MDSAKAILSATLYLFKKYKRIMKKYKNKEQQILLVKIGGDVV